MRNGPLQEPYVSGDSGPSSPHAQKNKPSAEDEGGLPFIISLFSGAGGLDLGFKDAGFTISVAIDSSEAAIRSHSRNFPGTRALSADLTVLKPEGVVAKVMERVQAGKRIAVIGGPPCQGFSRANTNAQENDPRNLLPKLYLEIVAELQSHYLIEFIVFENVLGIRDKRHEKTYKALVQGISNLGFEVTEKELCSADFGVPQNRRRIILSGMRKGQGYSEVKPRKRRGIETVREAIGGLQKPTFFRRDLTPDEIPVHPNHWTMQPKSPRFKNPDAQKGSGRRSFKRLAWDALSPTIAFGHREIHVHPNGRRRLSIFEAMLLQGFPETFVLEGNLSQQVEQISNAVPPPLAKSIAQAVKRAMKVNSV